MTRSVALIGMPGSGKSTIGQAVARLLGLPFADVDERIASLFGAIPNLFAQRGEPYFRQCEYRALQAILEEAPAIIATGGGIVTQQQSMEQLKSRSLIIFLDRPLELILQDIDISGRPLLAGGEASLRTLHGVRAPLYRQWADRIVANDGAPGDVIERVAKLIKEECL